MCRYSGRYVFLFVRHPGGSRILFPDPARIPPGIGADRKKAPAEKRDQSSILYFY
jgi:hypothetical protein